MEAGDRKQMHQPGLGKSVLKGSIDASTAAQNQRIYHGCTWSVQCTAGLTQHRSNASGDGRLPFPPPNFRDDQRAAGTPRPRGMDYPATIDRELEPGLTWPALWPSCGYAACARLPERPYFQPATFSL